jgi:8-oxo-dGTP pyrophosphatase MutT (NUDIX family)
MSRYALHEVARCLRGRPPVTVGHEPEARAAVAMVLAPADDELRILLIKRAEHPHDPWSGHMAFPGGRHDPADADLASTAIRETGEEVGIDLARHGELIARLDDVQAVAVGRHVDLVISPFLFSLERPLPTRIDRSEVADALWVPMRVFRDEGHRGTVCVARGDFKADFPAFVYRGYEVWGLTYRMLCGFFETIDAERAASTT